MPIVDIVGNISRLPVSLKPVPLSLFVLHVEEFLEQYMLLEDWLDFKTMIFRNCQCQMNIKGAPIVGRYGSYL